MAVAVLGPVVVIDAAGLLLPGVAKVGVSVAVALAAWIGVLVCFVLAGSRPSARPVGRALALAIPVSAALALTGLGILG